MLWEFMKFKDFVNSFSRISKWFELGAWGFAEIGEPSY
jgi:hypothetical protein